MTSYDGMMMIEFRAGNRLGKENTAKEFDTNCSGKIRRYLCRYFIFPLRLPTYPETLPIEVGLAYAEAHPRGRSIGVNISFHR